MSIDYNFSFSSVLCDIPVPGYLDGGDVSIYFAKTGGAHWAAHSHNQNQIIISVEAGSSCEISWGAKSGVAKTLALGGQYFLYIRKGVPHSFRIENEGIFISLGVSEEEVMRLTENNIWCDVKVVPWWKVLRHDIFIWDVIQSIRDLCYLKKHSHPRDLGALAQTLASHLLVVEQDRRASTTEGLTPLQLKKIDLYLEDHFRERPTVDDLASVVGLKRDHFSHLFKTATGISPHQYVIKLKMRYAQRLRNIGKINAAEIAAESGFCDQSHYNKAIRKCCLSNKHSRGILPKKADSSNPNDENSGTMSS